MESQKRGWVEITVDILEIARSPSNKMRIMYKANLNFDRFSRYFNELLRKGFVDELNGANGPTLYRTTERGRTLLAVLRKAQELVATQNGSEESTRADQ